MADAPVNLQTGSRINPRVRPFKWCDHWIRCAVQRAIANYNQLRPHRSCGYYTPAQAHRMQGELVKKWRVTKRRQQAKMQFDESMAAV
ncbi:integrase core domain-containing protein [Fibrivirga algicola]|uniref:integrase core domain-containing protein n=1 Tax=Fibrivirga algicola TaxID=2950420 RepID=UPI000A18C810